MDKFIVAALVLMFSGLASASEGMIALASPYSAQQTADRFEKIITSKGLTLFARINHSKNAAGAGMELRATEVIIFGNPKVGTPLMQCSQAMGIDLPQKVLVWQDAPIKYGLATTIRNICKSATTLKVVRRCSIKYRLCSVN